jgi:hypothetical protein
VVTFTVTTAAAAAIGLGVTVGLTDVFDGGSPASGLDDTRAPTPTDPFVGGMRSVSGYGPPRPVFRCARPRSCEGPRYVTFNSYFNTPRMGDERYFFAVQDDAWDANAPAVDSLSLDEGTRELTYRVYIDNNTYRTLPDRTTRALDTRLRVAFPRGPFYEARPTAYLTATNARPRTIWDTTDLRSSHPVRIEVVPDSTHLVEGPRDDPRSRPLTGDLTSRRGVSLGDWKADFVNSGIVTFRARVTPLPEPVRDPLATRAALGPIRFAPAATSGPLREPAGDKGDDRPRFRCTRTRCSGAPYVTLNAYENHPLLGDESDFVRGRVGGTYHRVGREVYRPVVLVRPHDSLTVRIAIDSGADPAAIGAPPVGRLVARDVRVQVLASTMVGRDLSITGYVTSRNAQPRTIADSLYVRSREPVRLVVRPETVSVFDAGGLRPLPMRLFVDSVHPPTRENRGVTIGDVAPSFAQVANVQFYVNVLPGR